MGRSGRVKKIPCGTRQGYRAHRHHGEVACEPCREANAAHARRMRNPERERARSKAARDEYRRNHPLPTASQRFLKKVKVGPISAVRPDLGPCLLWTEGVDKDGYGRFWLNGKNIPAHRFAVLEDGREIPEGCEPDHMCRVTSCVRASHLEVVTQAENMRRAVPFRTPGPHGKAALNAALTKCHRGHEFTEENTRYYAGRRHCRACGRDSSAKWAAKKKGAIA